MPRILVLAPWLQGGGAQGALVGILTRLPREQTDLVVIFRGNRNHEQLRQLVNGYSELDLPRTPQGVIQAAGRLSRMLGRYDRLYSLMRGSHLVLGLLRSRDLRRLRFVASFHQLPSEDSRGVVGAVENLLVKRASRVADLVTAPSERAVEELAACRFADPDRLEKEDNFVQVSSVGAHARDRADDDPVRLAFIGRITAQKGLDRLPSLLSGSAARIHLRIAGDGESAAEIRQLLQSIDGEHQVEFLGHISDVTPLLDWCDALVMPSRWELNPLAVWEAWARGRPVLAANLPVFSDLSRVGPLWTFDDPNDFSELIHSNVIGDTNRETTYRQCLRAASHQERSRIVEHLIA